MRGENMADKEVLTLRLEYIEKAQQRTRNAFFLALLASAVVLLLCNNIIFPPLPRQPHIEGTTYSVPILGVPLGVNTLTVFGPVSLVIFSFYLASCFRSSESQLESLEGRLDTYSGADEREKIAIVLNSESVLDLPSPRLRISTNRDGLRSLLYWLLIFLPALVSIIALGTDWSIFASLYDDVIRSSDSFKSWFLDNGVIFDIEGLCISFLVCIYCSSSVASARKSANIIRRIVFPKKVV
jgi:hypothetical protein